MLVIRSTFKQVQSMAELHFSNKFANCALINLVLRVSSFLYLYSGIQEAIRQSDWPSAIFHLNSVFRRVNGRGMSKFDVKPISFTFSDHPLQFISYVRRITSHFILEAAVKFSITLNLGSFSPKQTVFIFTLNTLANPRLLFKYLQKIEISPQSVCFSVLIYMLQK